MKPTLSTLAFLLITLTTGASLVYAGSLTPPGPAEDTMYTLTDLYNLANGTTATEGSGTIPSTPGSASPTFHTLSDIYDALAGEIDNLSNETLASGVSAFGFTGNSNVVNTSSGDAATGDIASGKKAWVDGVEVTGSASGVSLANMYNGTGGSATGGSQDNGGTDDYDAGPSAPGRYEATWTACTVGNSYCGTGQSGADAKDENTGLVWSLPCKKTTSDCDTFTETSPSSYSWDNSAANNNGKTASQLCSAGSHGQSGWRLPHQRQLMQAYIDGSYGNLEPIGEYYSYLSATVAFNDVLLDSTYYPWNASLSSGGMGNGDVGSTNSIRCVRLPN